MFVCFVVMYKYLNPNIVVVVAEGEEAASTTSAKGMDVCLFVCCYVQISQPQHCGGCGGRGQGGCLHHFRQLYGCLCVCCYVQISQPQHCCVGLRARRLPPLFQLKVCLLACLFVITYRYLNPNIVVVEAASTTSAEGMLACLLVCLFVITYRYLNPNIVVVEAASTTSAEGMLACLLACLFVITYRYLNSNIVVVEAASTTSAEGMDVFVCLLLRTDISTPT